MDEYFLRFGGVRDYLHVVVDEAAQGPATPRRSSADAATCPISRATTGSAARWPSAWRSTRRSRAAPPTSSRSRCSASHRALAEEGLRRRVLLQVHDELVLEVAAGRAGDVEKFVRGRWARPTTLAVPLDVSVGSAAPGTTLAH